MQPKSFFWQGTPGFIIVVNEIPNVFQNYSFLQQFSHFCIHDIRNA